MTFLAGKKTFAAMGIALGVALYQHFVGPLPAVDKEVWDIAVPAVAIILRVVTHKPVVKGDVLAIIWRSLRFKRRT